MVVVANAASYGDGLRIAPRAQLDDGMLDVCFVKGASRLRLLSVAHTVLSGAHLRLPEVIYTQASGVTLQADPPQPIYADGEFVCMTPATFNVVPNAMRVIVPV
jgi:diacylglycerol kinase family enzyme